MSDPTPIRNQASLTTSSGRIWLVVGALLTVICGGVLVALGGNPPEGLGFGAAVVIGILYLGMIMVRLAVPPGRLRLGLMAAGLIAIAAIALVCTLVIAWSTAGDVFAIASAQS